jgi:hypothetical protein
MFGMPTPRFDATITWGNLLTAATFAVAAFAAWAAMAKDVGVLAAEARAVGAKVHMVEQRMETITNLMTSDARRETELVEVRRRLDRIEQQQQRAR